MRVELAHLRERSTTGQVVDFAIFNAKALNNTDSARGTLLFQLTVAARANDLKVDAAALTYEEHGRIKTWGDPFAVDYLAKRGVPRWTHWLDV
jgi:hypothetical protein